MKAITIYSDGGARGNPGPAGAGAVLFDEEQTVLAEIAQPLGIMTNNQAEYWAVVFALEALTEMLAEYSDVTVTYNMDSQLIEQQLAGNYKVKNAGLRPLYDRVRSLLAALPVDVTFHHIPRRLNKYADRLSNDAMDIVQRGEEYDVPTL